MRASRRHAARTSRAGSGPVPPACGSAAPSSAQTRPSHTTSSAPRIQPTIACGPCIVATISGMVTNGPTPIMSIMFSAVACHSPMPRTRVPSEGISETHWKWEGGRLSALERACGQIATRPARRRSPASRLNSRWRRYQPRRPEPSSRLTGPLPAGGSARRDRVRTRAAPRPDRGPPPCRPAVAIPGRPALRPLSGILATSRLPRLPLRVRGDALAVLTSAQPGRLLTVLKRNSPLVVMAAGSFVNLERRVLALAADTHDAAGRLTAYPRIAGAAPNDRTPRPRTRAVDRSRAPRRGRGRNPAV